MEPHTYLTGDEVEIILTSNHGLNTVHINVLRKTQRVFSLHFDTTDEPSIRPVVDNREKKMKEKKNV